MVKSRSSTPRRILDAGLVLFNEKGYTATTLTEIAAAVGISQGNLTYHFPTKRDLARRLEAEALDRISTRNAALTVGDIADDYLEHLLFTMDLTWRFRFLPRDRAHYSDGKEPPRMTAAKVAAFDELYGLLKRLQKEEMLRRDLGVAIEDLARSLWIVSRYWMDYLREAEGQDQIEWRDQERGIRQHFAVLFPCLTAPARRKFDAAFERAMAQA